MGSMSNSDIFCKAIEEFVNRYITLESTFFFRIRDSEILEGAETECVVTSKKDVHRVERFCMYHEEFKLRAIVDVRKVPIAIAIYHY